MLSQNPSPQGQSNPQSQDKKERISLNITQTVQLTNENDAVRLEFPNGVNVVVGLESYASVPDMSPSMSPGL